MSYSGALEHGNIDSLQQLNDDVLGEVVREAERRLDAQLTTANAADQRAMAWAAILVTGSIAIIGASAALLVGGKSLLLAGLGVGISAILGTAIFKATVVFRPKDWHFPGNIPANWAPELWQCHGTATSCNIRQAKLEQASSLDEQIRENVQAAKEAGEQLKLSMDLALFSVVAGVVGVGLLVLLTAIGVVDASL